VKEAIVQISVQTGRMVREILPPVRVSSRGPLCQVLWSDPSGRVAAAICGTLEALDLGGHESSPGLEQGIVSDGNFREAHLNLPYDLVINLSPGDLVAW
jgi:hypothetical protein